MSHKEHDIFENRIQFQLERMILFSDAVFAIAITLLVIEIRIPTFDFTNPTEEQLMFAISHKSGEFFGLVMSFAVIGLFWVQHHRLFGLVNNFDQPLLWLNLHLLFWIILVPFSSGLNSHYGDMDKVWMWYSFNMFMIGLSLFFLWNYIGSPKRKLSVIAHDPVRRKYAKMRSIGVALIFLSGLLLCLPGWEPTSVAARFIYFLIYPLMIFLNRRYASVHKEKGPA